MNKSTKLKIIIGIQILLLVFTLLFLLGNQPSTKAHVGIVLLIFGIAGLTGCFWKSKLGFFVSLTYQYFILTLLIIGSIATLDNLRSTLILTLTNLLMIFSITIFNSKDIKTNYGISTKGIPLNIGSAIIGLLVSMSILLYLA